MRKFIKVISIAILTMSLVGCESKQEEVDGVTNEFNTLYADVQKDIGSLSALSSETELSKFEVKLDRLEVLTYEIEKLDDEDNVIIDGASGMIDVREEISYRRAWLSALRSEKNFLAKGAETEKKRIKRKNEIKDLETKADNDFNTYSELSKEANVWERLKHDATKKELREFIEHMNVTIAQAKAARTSIQNYRKLMQNTSLPLFCALNITKNTCKQYKELRIGDSEIKETALLLSLKTDRRKKKEAKELLEELKTQQQAG